MASRLLTPNGIAAVLGGDLDLKPVMQITDLRPITGHQQERYRLMISDGSASHTALLAAQLNGLIKTGRVRIGSIVQLLEYICSDVQGKRLIVVLNMEVILEECEVAGNMSSSTGGSATHNPAPYSNGGNPTIRPSASMQPPRFYSNSVNANSSNKPLSYQPIVQPSYKPPPSYKSHGAIMKNEAPPRIIPISALNPYQGRWAIKARVTAKGDLRRYNNARGDGKVFSFDLLDSDGGEIRCTCFNAVVDRFYDVIEVGKVYLISKGSLKPAQKNFNHLNNEWEVFLETSSFVEPCPEEDNSIPDQQFNFRSISEIESMENNSIVDIIGIVTFINPSTTILRKNGMETQRRILNLKDVSGRSVELTLWGEFCNKEGRQLEEIISTGFFPVVAVKAGKVNDFSGKSVGTISSTQLFINPDSPEAQRLRNWFDGGGKDVASQSISKDVMPGLPWNEIRKSVIQIKDEGLGRGDKPDWVTVKASLTFIKTDSFCYSACPLMVGDRQCNKKVTKQDNGKWFCDRCDKELDECDYRYLLQAQVQDHTGLTWVTAFQESGEEILGCSAKELYMLKYEDSDETRFTEIMKRRLFGQFMLRLKIKEEHYGEEQRVKITVVKAEKVNPSAESRYLLDLISKLSPPDERYYVR